MSNHAKFWIVFLILIGVLLLTNLFAEYVISRELEPHLQIVGFLTYIFIVVQAGRLVYKVIVKPLKKKEE